MTTDNRQQTTDMGKILYTFYSKSQHIIILKHQGRKFKVRFSTPYGGVAYFYTTDAELAQRVRDSMQFRQGTIKESTPKIAVESKPQSVVTAKPQPNTESTAGDKRPQWMQVNTKRKDDGGERTYLSPRNASDAAVMEADAQANANAASAEEGEMKMGETLFGEMKPEDVENFMDAKTYLKDVKGASAEDVRTKEQMSAFCAANGIVFPNYSL